MYIHWWSYTCTYTGHWYIPWWSHTRPLVVTYHPALPPLRATTKQYQPTCILHTSELFKQAFPWPPLIAFRHPKNLKDLLVRATLTTTQHNAPGNYRCGSGGGKTCPILLTTNTFASHMTGERFTISIIASCKSYSVIYLITCRRCGQQYVGETGQSLHLGMNGRHYDIMRKRTEDSPVSAHFNHGTHPSRQDSHGDRPHLEPWFLSTQNLREQVDLVPENFVPFWNESQCGRPVIPAPTHQTPLISAPWLYYHARTCVELRYHLRIVLYRYKVFIFHHFRMYLYDRCALSFTSWRRLIRVETSLAIAVSKNWLTSQKINS